MNIDSIELNKHNFNKHIHKQRSKQGGKKAKVKRKDEKTHQ